MAPDDSRTRDILEIRDQLARKAEECETELEYLRRNIAVLDSVIKKSSFTRASDIEIPDSPPAGAGDAGPAEPAAPQAAEPQPAAPPGSRPMTAGSRTLGHAIVEAGQLRMILGDGVDLSPDTPPLKTFFVGRIIGGMRAKDEAGVQSGELGGDSVIECSINADAGRIRDIVVKNYRDQKRADEIISSASWSFARMLEKSS